MKLRGGSGPDGARPRERGLTLIELSTVIVILALVVTVATAYLDQTLPQSRLEAAARSLAAQIDNLRTFSIAQGKAYRIEYDLPGRRYRVVSPFRPDGKVAEREEERVAMDWIYLPDGVVFDDVTIGAGERIVEGTVPLEFTPLGTSIEHRVHIRRVHPERRYTISVAGLTGQIRFVDGYEERTEVAEGDFPK
jgi:prepilin-type N-terminal cleavage/methylation domain-containing protein